MVWLRLNRLQLALVLLSLGLLFGGVAAFVPSRELPQAVSAPQKPTGQDSFAIPLLAVANDPQSPLVQGNPFDASRQPPVQRRTSTTAVDENGDQVAAPPVNFVLLGTVVVGNGRDMAVIQGNPATPGGEMYHVGEAPAPGWRVTRITRDGATVVGEGQSLDLKVQQAASSAGQSPNNADEE